MNLPNLLSLLRIFLVPAFLIAIIYGALPAALALFVLAGATDAMDGFFARRLGQCTRLGAYLDPVADKLLVATAFISMAAIDLIPAWLTVLVVSKDLFIALGAAMLFFSGKSFAAVPTLWGKQTTFLEIAVVFLVLSEAIGLTELRAWFLVLFGLTAFAATASGLHYILTGLKYFHEEKG